MISLHEHINFNIIFYWKYQYECVKIKNVYGSNGRRKGEAVTPARPGVLGFGIGDILTQNKHLKRFQSFFEFKLYSCVKIVISTAAFGKMERGVSLSTAIAQQPSNKSHCNICINYNYINTHSQYFAITILSTQKCFYKYNFTNKQDVLRM